MVIIQGCDGQYITIDDKSVIYNCDLLISYRDFNFDEIIKIPYSSAALKEIIENHNVNKLNMNECLEICNMSDFMGITNNYIMSIYGRLGYHLTKNRNEEVIMDNLHLFENLERFHPELHLIYDIPSGIGTLKDEVIKNIDHYITYQITKSVDRKDLERYIKADNLDMWRLIIDKFKINKDDCLSMACKYGAISIIKHILKTGTKFPQELVRYIHQKILSNKNIQSEHWLNVTAEELRGIAYKGNLDVLKFLMPFCREEFYIDRRRLLNDGHVDVFVYLCDLETPPFSLKYTINPNTINDENKILKLLGTGYAKINVFDLGDILKLGMVSLVEYMMKTGECDDKFLRGIIRRTNGISPDTLKIIQERYLEN